MPNYTDIIGRGDVPVPEETATQVITDALQESVLLKRARRQPMSTKTHKQPVLSTLPEAYWVNGDTGLKQTTKFSFKAPVMTAEELAAIAVVPDAVFDDTSIPLWDSLRPLIAEAIGNKVDSAGIFGIDKPETWPNALVPGAVAAGNAVEISADPGVAIANLGAHIAENSGYNMNGLIVPGGFGWRLRALRDTNGQFVYDAANGALMGIPADEMQTGLWPETTPASRIIGVDWTKVYIGVRQDITIKILDQSVISDENGKVIINLAQQDAKAMRVVFRVGFQVYDPVNHAKGAVRYPAGVIRDAAAAGGGA